MPDPSTTNSVNWLGWMTAIFTAIAGLAAVVSALYSYRTTKQAKEGRDEDRKYRDIEIQQSSYETLVVSLSFTQIDEFASQVIDVLKTGSKEINEMRSSNSGVKDIEIRAKLLVETYSDSWRSLSDVLRTSAENWQDKSLLKELQEALESLEDIYPQIENLQSGKQTTDLSAFIRQRVIGLKTIITQHSPIQKKSKT